VTESSQQGLTSSTIPDISFFLPAQELQIQSFVSQEAELLIGDLDSVLYPADLDENSPVSVRKKNTASIVIVRSSYIYKSTTINLP
jgi:hypothetical protein